MSSFKQTPAKSVKSPRAHALAASVSKEIVHTCESVDRPIGSLYCCQRKRLGIN